MVDRAILIETAATSTVDCETQNMLLRGRSAESPVESGQKENELLVVFVIITVIVVLRMMLPSCDILGQQHALHCGQCTITTSLCLYSLPSINLLFLYIYINVMFVYGRTDRAAEIFCRTVYAVLVCSY